MEQKENNFDLIIVGAGHAGCEAAYSAAIMGLKVLILTMDMTKIAHMSCNPAMGGIAKGQIIREIDALGGGSGKVSDASTIQFRMLNRSKGPAMWSPRSQNDRFLFSQYWRELLEQNVNIFFYQDTVNQLVLKGSRCVGVKTQNGNTFTSKAVVLTTGTFLNGLIHIGLLQQTGGRMAERPSSGITEQLVQLGFVSGRMKTGTPPRVDGRSLNYSKMEVQEGDLMPSRFSYYPRKTELKKQYNCWITYTNEHVHEVLRTGFNESPMYNGTIQGIGPRYCPSIEDKINRFSERDRHQIFVEPEGWNTIEIYVNGFSTSLPEKTQKKALSLIPGFENAKIFRPGYAIEYDFFQPTQLKSTLETKLITGLYFAGQINGTTGYEEAACQGLMAGINAALKIKEKEPFVLQRNEAYIGVLIDDLINKGTEEPYRMFTSRAEYRIHLRQDNADVRLTRLGHAIGLASDHRVKMVEQKEDMALEITQYLTSTSITPAHAQKLLSEKNSSAIKQNVKLTNLLSRPHITIGDMETHIPSVQDYMQKYSEDAKLLSEINIKYSGYLEKELQMVEKHNRLENIRIPDTLDYKAITSLSSEAKEKLHSIQPVTLGQASRISGVSPADISVLLLFLGR